MSVPQNLTIQYLKLFSSFPEKCKLIHDYKFLHRQNFNYKLLELWHLELSTLEQNENVIINTESFVFKHCDRQHMKFTLNIQLWHSLLSLLNNPLI